MRLQETTDKPVNVVRHLRVLLLSFFLAALQFHGAAPAAITPEEVKNDSVAARPGDAVAPRTIRDVTDLLDQYKPDAAKAAQLRAQASGEPPPGLEGKALAQFYWDRARAAQQLGMVARQIADLNKTLELGGAGDKRRVLQEFASAQAQGGNYFAAIQARKEIGGAAGGGPQLGWVLSDWAFFARMDASAGDIPAASADLSKADAALAEAFRSGKGGWMRHGWTGTVEWARGAVLDAQGKRPKAEAAYRRALSEYEQDVAISEKRLQEFAGAPTRETMENARDVVTLNLGANLMHQGRLDEAEVLVRGVLRQTLERNGKYSVNSARVVATFSRLLFEEGRYREAEILAATAKDILDQTGVLHEARIFAGARRTYASALTAEARWAEALAEYETMRAELSKDPALVENFGGGDVNWGLALIKTGKAREAADMLAPLLAKTTVNFGENHYATAEIRGFYAMALAQSGERERAYYEFKKALARLSRGSLEAEQDTGARARGWRLALIVDAYIALLYELRGDPLQEKVKEDFSAESFRVADIARGQSVQRALTASAARAAVNVPGLGELVRREQDARAQSGALLELLNNMLSAPIEQQIPRVISDLRVQIEQLRADATRFRQEIEGKYPKYTNLINPKPATAEEAQAVMRPGEALVSILVTPEHTFVWALPKEGKVVFVASILAEREVDTMVRALRKSVDVGDARSIFGLPEFNMGIAYQLYQQLLQPVESGWKDADNLLLITSGALGMLPLALLPTKPADLPRTESVLFERYRNAPWLIRRAALTQIPSVNSLVTLRALPPANPNRTPFAGFGDPQFGKAALQVPAEPSTRMRNLSVMRVAGRGKGKIEQADWIDYSQLPPLPDTRDEILAIAAALHADLKNDVFLGVRASKESVNKTNLSNRRVVAFATHGLLPGDFPGLTEPALALAAPAEGDGKLTGLFTLDDVLTLKLDADWVVLSACNSAAGDGAGAEAVSGLGRGFFYAGSRALLVTHWPVETVSARLLVTGIFQRYSADPALSRAEALRQSMLSLMESGYVDLATNKTVFSYAHPLFWAPYALVGEGGNSGR